MASFFGFASPLVVDVRLDGVGDDNSLAVASSSSGAAADPSTPSATPRAMVPFKKEGGGTETLPLYTTGDTVKGTVVVRTAAANKRVEHQGIRVELLGQIELFFDRGNFYDFVALNRELEPPGDVTGEVRLPFEFKAAELQYESYTGINVRLRYVVKVTVTRGYGGSVIKEFPFCVRAIQTAPEINDTLKMEVGIEDCLHIEFEYSKAKYHLKDVVVGKIYFLLVRIRIKHMDLEIRRRESTGSGANTYNESETLAKFEVMDGAPVRTESIPIRLFLSPYDLSPSYKNVNNKFSVRYFLNLVLVDEEDRRYFKSQEIVLWRNELL